MTSRIDAFGLALEQQLTSIEEHLASPVHARLLGIVMGLSVIGAGITTFIVVLIILVQLFA
jgi:hypothetical protein